MRVDREGVRRFADLARLRLEDEELDRLTADVNDILDHVDVLGELDASAEAPVPPSPRGPVGSTPEETAAEPDRLARTPDELAPEWRDGFFVVPRLPGVDAEERG